MSNVYAVIVDNIVVNKVIASSELAEINGWVLLPDGVNIGWTYDGGFEEPAPMPEPAPTPEPTKEELLAQLQVLTAKINALIGV